MKLHFSFIFVEFLIMAGNGNKNGLFTILLRDYSSHAAATCMNRLAKLRYVWFVKACFMFWLHRILFSEQRETWTAMLHRFAA